MRVIFSPATKIDLLEIATYIARDNPTRADSFVDELEGRSVQLADTPHIGSPRPELGDGVRVLVHGHYLIFYRVVEGSVRIERVLHGAQDITAADFVLEGNA